MTNYINNYCNVIFYLKNEHSISLTYREKGKENFFDTKYSQKKLNQSREEEEEEKKEREIEEEKDERQKIKVEYDWTERTCVGKEKRQEKFNAC